MSVAAGGDGGAPAQMENKGTVVIYSPYLNKHKTIQEVRRPFLPRHLHSLFYLSSTPTIIHIQPLLLSTPSGLSTHRITGLTDSHGAQGRRIPQNLACEDPTAWEILEVTPLSPIISPRLHDGMVANKPGSLLHVMGAVCPMSGRMGVHDEWAHGRPRVPSLG